jgi:hypothetical protein
VIARFLRRRRAGVPKPAEPTWVRIAWARHQPEAELIIGLLRNAGIPAFARRSGGVDVPDMLAGGTREVLVPAGRALEAHALLDPMEASEDPEEDGPA